MKQTLDKTNRWPFPKYEYILRSLWLIVQSTIWKICWHRISFLRMFLLKLFGADINPNSLAFSSCKISRPWDLKMGTFVALGPRVYIYNLAKTSIGDHTIISQDVYICGGTHDYTDPTLPLLRQDVVIGNNVWICAGAFIGPGVTIGDGAIVAARAVVVKDVEPWTVVGGNPARFIKKRELKA